MDDLLKQERTHIDVLESSLSPVERKQKEEELDNIRERIESKSAPMDAIYSYISDHDSKISWKRLFSGDGFTNAQLLVSSLMNEKSPLKSILLYHGVGVGKTCAAIAGASSYKNDKQIIVLTPSDTLIKNWRAEFIGRNHCGRHIWNITDSNWTSMTERQRVKLLNSHVSIMGYLKFANKVESIMATLNETDPQLAMIKAVRLLCDNSLIIMDEIHGTRQVGSDSMKDDDLKKIRPILETISKYARQNKMILLSATPMYNDVREMEWIINLMRWNQGLSGMTWKKWYNHKNNNWLVPQSRSKQYFMDKIRGFVSYIRGENPITFPRRLYPSKDDFTMREEGGLQLIISDINKELSDYLENIKKTAKDSFGSAIIQNTLSVQNKLQEIGENWTPEDAQTWSPKLWTCWSSLKDSVGPVFIYSQYLQHGIYEMGRILERMGWKRIGGPSLLSKDESRKRLNDPYCWANKCFRSKIPSDSTKSFVQAKFCLVDGQSRNLYDLINIFNNPNNISGDQCAVLIGSRVIEVGVSLMRVRQSHILEPWYHINSLEQANGRAIRNKSHIDLPIEDRNVSIFLHCAVGEDNEEDDNIDLHMYKIGIDKMRMMAEVTKLMAENAIDCDIQKSINYIRDTTMMKAHDSFGKEIMIQKGDNDFSARCGFSKCEIGCSKSVIPTIDQTDAGLIQLELEANKVFPTNFDILLERLPAVIQSLPVVDSVSVAESLGVSKDNAKQLLQMFVEQRRSFPSIVGVPTYLHKLEDDVYISNLYPQHVLPIESTGIIPVKDKDNGQIIQEIPTEDLLQDDKDGDVDEDDKKKLETVSATSATSATSVEPTTTKLETYLEELNRLLRMVNGISPMRKSVEKSRILTVANLNSTAALRKQSAYQRYIAYGQSRKAGESLIGQNELFSSIIVSFVEHLTNKDNFLRLMIETDPKSMPKYKFGLLTIRESLSDKGLGMKFVPFLMNYDKHIKPFIPLDIDIKASNKELNAYCYTNKDKCYIKILKEDNTWQELLQSVIGEWKDNLKPLLNESKEKDNIWITGYIDPTSYDFYLRIEKQTPTGKVVREKKKKIIGGLCGQTTFVRNLEEIVIIIKELTGIDYLATTNRLTIGKKVLPSGIYYPRATGKEIFKSMYLGGVNKQVSKTSTGASLCEELEYILRIIAYSSKTHPSEPYVVFSSSVEHFIERKVKN